MDWMHCLSLGVFCFLLGHFLHELIAKDAWRIRCGTKQVFELSIVRIRSGIFDWYDAEEKAGRNHSRLQALTVQMLGPTKAPFLKLDAGETNGFLRYAHGVLLPQFGAKLGGRAKPYKLALDSCVTLLDICWPHKRQIPPDQVQRFCDAAVQHLQTLEDLGPSQRPKHHQTMELGARLSVHI